MALELGVARSLEDTPTWALAVVCTVMIVLSIFMEHILHLVEKWLESKHRRALMEALEKVKAELMLMGFMSLILVAFQAPISQMCIPVSVADTWHPCSSTVKKSKSDYDKDSCGSRGRVALVSSYGIHQLHIFIFVLAATHILFCIITLALGRTKMNEWKSWEDETRSIEYQYCNDPERFRFARDTSFGRRHLNLWSQSTLTLWIRGFFRQFSRSVTKVDYQTLRHGFIAAHLTPESETKFDFQKYISRSLEEDFTVVVGISPFLWFVAMLSLLTNTNGWYSHLWLPFIPLIIILLVGTKLQMIITKLGLRIQERGDVVKGVPLVEPGDELFWFGRPHLMLILIHLVLFQNAFQVAFFAWSTYAFTIHSCYHQRLEDIIIRISTGVIIEVLCSYVTLPLYALVNQMGSKMKPTIFNDRVAAALKTWHKTAKKHTKHGRHSEATTPFTSRPATPTHGMSPIHLLHNYPRYSNDSHHTSPRHSNFDNEQWGPESVHSPRNHEGPDESQHVRHFDIEQERPTPHPNSTQLPPAPRAIRTQHEIDVGLSDFSFEK